MMARHRALGPISENFGQAQSGLIHAGLTWGLFRHDHDPARDLTRPEASLLAVTLGCDVELSVLVLLLKPSYYVHKPQLTSPQQSQNDPLVQRKLEG